MPTSVAGNGIAVSNAITVLAGQAPEDEFSGPKSARKPTYNFLREPEDPSIQANSEGPELQLPRTALYPFEEL